MDRRHVLIEWSWLMAKLSVLLQYKLTLVSAPPGYGKTTITAQFAHQAQSTVAWHTVEERERDIPNLYAHCLSALSHIDPKIEKLGLRAGLAPGELAALVADYLRDNVSDDIVYVMDDVQHLTGSLDATAWLNTFVARMPSNCHLVLCSRMLPDLPLVEMIARREVLAIGQQELRFTLQEIHSLTTQLLGYAPPLGEVNELAARLDGWPAGTVLALQPLPPELERAILREGQGPEALFDALAASMLRAQHPALRDFLLRSSTLTRVTPELCSGALLLSDSVEQIAQAQMRNLFLIRGNNGLVYHTLFRSFLQRQLQNDDSELFEMLHVRAARWFEARDEVELAIDHYLTAEQVDNAVALAERMAHAYFVQGKIETLLSWGTRLRHTGVPAPILMSTCASAHTDRYEYATATLELDEAEKGFALEGNEARLIGVRLQRAMIDMQRGAYQEAALQASDLLQTAADSDNRRGRILRILGFARFSMGEIEQGIEQLEESVILHRADGDVYALTNVLQDLQTCYTRVGRLDEVAACLQGIVALRRSLGSMSALALALNNLGCYYHLRGSYMQALAIFQEGLSVAAKAPNKRAESYLLWSLGDLQRDRNAFDEAVHLYDKALELIGGSEPLLRSSILISLSTLRRWQNQFSEASLLAEEALTLAGMYNMAQESVIAQAFVWAARAHLGQSALAARKLDTTITDLRTQNLQSALVSVLGLRARIALLHHHEDVAKELLHGALKAAESVAGIQSLAAEWGHTPALELLVTTNSMNYGQLVVEMKKLRQVLIRITNLQHATMRIISRVTYSLNILTLGQESIELDGQRIPTSAWRATTAKEGFLYILFRGPVSRDGLSAVFWPDSSSRHVRGSFHTTLHRVRQALGSNIIALQDDMYRINPDVDVRCDANEMETLVLQARLLSPRDAGTEELWRKAVELYRGDFLIALDSDWVFSRREALREAYLEALIGLGECMRVRRDFKGALARLKVARDVDPYREDIHRAIMTCYAEMGEKNQVLLHYQQLQNLLYEDLAIEPSAETVALRDTLLR